MVHTDVLSSLVFILSYDSIKIKTAVRKFIPYVLKYGLKTRHIYAIILLKYKPIGGTIMAIKHTAVSYYGLNYVEHARADFE